MFELGEEPLPIKVKKDERRKFRTEASCEALTASQQIQIANEGLR